MHWKSISTSLPALCRKSPLFQTFQQSLLFQCILPWYTPSAILRLSPSNISDTFWLSRHFQKTCKNEWCVLYLILEMPLRRIENAHDFGNYFRAFCRTFLSTHPAHFCCFFDYSQSCRMVKKTPRRVQLLIPWLAFGFVARKFPWRIFVRAFSLPPNFAKPPILRKKFFELLKKNRKIQKSFAIFSLA